MNKHIQSADELQESSKRMLAGTFLLEILGKLGKVTQTGSSTMGLMVYPDIDFAIQTDKPIFQDAIKLTQVFFTQLNVTALKLADFSGDKNESASYYVGIEFPFDGKVWHIDVTIGKQSPIITNPPELAIWLKNMTMDQRVILLKLKKELYDAKRYIGSKSQPPYTFRSSHLYEAVLNGGANTVQEAEEYFKLKRLKYDPN